MAIEHSTARQICRHLRYADLVELGIVRNRVTLQNWVKDRGFPAGRLLGPNARAWREKEVEAWIASRPTALKPIPPVKNGRRGRPRKVSAEATVEA